MHLSYSSFPKGILALSLLFVLLTSFTYAVEWDGVPGRHPRPKRSRCYTEIMDHYQDKEYLITMELQGPQWRSLCMYKDLWPLVKEYHRALKTQGSPDFSFLSNLYTRIYYSRGYCTVRMNHKSRDWIQSLFTCIAPMGAEPVPECESRYQLEMKEEREYMKAQRERRKALKAQESTQKGAVEGKGALDEVPDDKAPDDKAPDDKAPDGQSESS